MLELGAPWDVHSSPHGGPWKIPLAPACLGWDRCPAGSCLSAAWLGGLLVQIGRVTQEVRPGCRHLWHVKTAFSGRLRVVLIYH